MPPSISDRVRADGLALADSSESLAVKIPEVLSAYLGTNFAVHAGYIAAAAGHEVLNFHAIVHTARSSPPAFQPEDVACVIEPVPTGKRVPELPERFHMTPKIGGLPVWLLKYHSARFEDV